MGNGSLAQLAQFRVDAGNLSFPLLQDCADGSSSSDTNLIRPYFERDNYVVIDQGGVIRYHAADFWPYGNRYHRDELRGVINGLLAPTGVDGGPVVIAVRAAPNPFREASVIEVSNPASVPTPARVRIVDPSGRLVVTLFEGLLPGGPTRLHWDGRAASGVTAAPGLYFLRADVGGARSTRRIVRLR